jgi:hypothetical protein
MPIDLTGGIDPAREHVFAERPDDPAMRDSVSFWVSDDRGAVGLPRIGIEAVAANWDGESTFNEGYVFLGDDGDDGDDGGADAGRRDGGLVPARVVEAPWLTELQPLGQDVSLVLETADGTVRIEGETVLSTFDVFHDDDTEAIKALKQEMPDFPALQQAGVRYRWDGEETYGMLERSYPLSKITRRWK